MIELLKYLFLGFIQGLTETIPVSSSGHLMIFKSLINLDIDFEVLAIVTNFGSLLAIIVLFWNDLIDLFTGFLKYLKKHQPVDKAKYKYCWLVVLGCIPAGFVGLLVSVFDVFEKIEDNVKIVGVSLLITATLLFMVRKFNGKKGDDKLKVKDALIIGCFQILGIFPGISRSGSTIAGGMSQNLKRDTAFKFSFMMYIPISMAALILDLKDINIFNENIGYYVASMIVAGIVTYLVTRWFRKIVNEGKLVYFSIYCAIVGILVILFL